MTMFMVAFWSAAGISFALGFTVGWFLSKQEADRRWLNAIYQAGSH